MRGDHAQVRGYLGASMLRSLPAFLLLTVVLAPMSAQRPPRIEKVDAFKDPYTKNDPGHLASLGYVNVGQFVWVGDITTPKLQEILGSDTAIFIETEHFKLACTLRSFPWPKEKDRREALTAELEALAARCPEFKTKVRALDPWLRAHLFAQRLEKLYADFCAALAIDPTRFPKEKGSPRGPDYLGEGPHLGMPEKFGVMICHKALSVGTLTRTLYGHAATDSYRFNDVGNGMLFFGTAAEFADKGLLDDRKLHCHVAYSVVHNLLDGYKTYTHRIPAWIEEGLPLWFSRPIDEEFRNFVGKDDAGATTLKGHEWERRVRLRVEHEVWPKAERFLSIFGGGSLTFVDNMMAWSRVDCLLAQGPEKAGAFVGLLKAPVTTEPRQPTEAEVLARQREALQQVLGWDDAAFDRAWVEFVVAKYPKK